VISTVVPEYPERDRERDRWILERRPARNDVDPHRPHDSLLEKERSASGEVVTVATIFLTSVECAWRCLMCDLWRNTLTAPAPAGSIGEQIDYALSRLPPARHVKLYNSGSFFDPRAVPPAEYADIAARLRGFDRVIVECHPALVGDSCARFRDALDTELEVAMGLETADEKLLARLNKRLTLAQYSTAAKRLQTSGIAIRTFILVKPPFCGEQEAVDVAARSLDFAFAHAASVAALIPTRSGNGALDALAERGEFSPPSLATVEAAAAYGIGLRRGRVFTDLWDLDRFSTCPSCYPARSARLNDMNLRQSVPAAIRCDSCGASGGET